MDSLPHEKKIKEYESAIEHLKKQNGDSSLFSKEILNLGKKLEQLKKQIYKNISPWERVLICRHSKRPRGKDFIEHLFEDFQLLQGDRLYRDDCSVLGGLGKINGVSCVVLAQEKGHDTDSRVKHNFGMIHPEGYRKALRLMKLAEKFRLPVIVFLDTPGAYPGLEAEKRGQGWAIAENLKQMAVLQTPIIVVLIGEGSSGGALGMGVGDVILMLEHAYYSVISPEGCASILWKDSQKNKHAADVLKMHAEYLKEFGIVDEIIKEPLGGAHLNPFEVYKTLSMALLHHMDHLEKTPLPSLLANRYQKYRRIGTFSENTGVAEAQLVKLQTA